MNPKKRLPMDDDSLDALIVLVLTESSVVPEELQPDDDCDAFLSWEDRMALEAIDDDLVDQILAGEWQSPLRPRRSTREHRDGRRELAGALNREGEDSDLPDEVRDAIEQRIRELDEEDKRKDNVP